MYFTIVFEREEDGIADNKSNEQIENAIGEFEWVKPISNFYVISCNTNKDRSEIVNNLKSISMRFLASPLCESGRFNGRMQSSIISNFKKITNPEEDV